MNLKCVDPCIGTCGQNAECRVKNHNPICYCRNSYTGDPFTRCYPVPPVVQESPQIVNPCVPSPCGPYSECRDIGGAPGCSCRPGYIGTSPNCRPECVINAECPRDKACFTEKCRDPCPGSCGAGAECSVVNHTPICTCPAGYEGDPFTYCNLKPIGKFLGFFK